MNKFRILMRILSICLTIFSLTNGAWSMAPISINYQGFLTDNNGAPLDTTVDITYRIYHEDSGGTPVYDEIVVTSVQNGYFEAVLGTPLEPLSPIVFDNATMYLGISIGEDTEMTPRIRFHAVPYAYRVATVDSATGGTVTGDVNIIGQGNIGTGNSNFCDHSFVVG